MTAAPASIVIDAFAGMLRAERARARLSQRELGELIGANRNTVQSWESGHTSPSIDTVYRIADALHISISRLLPAIPESTAA